MSQYRTPLRYPGGKQRLAPFILELLRHNGLIGCNYVEPYAGGAGVAIELLIDEHVSHIHLNDSSRPVYAFWKSVLLHTNELCQRIRDTPLTIEEWKKHRAVVQQPEQQDDLDLGFSTFYLNRCNRSGVLSGGVIGGLKQEGPWKLDARFDREKLIKRIEVVAERADKIFISNVDAEEYIQAYIPTLDNNTLVYCDPPYFDQSSHLYLNRYRKTDHERIAKTIQTELQRKWVVSYDGAPEILSFYRERRGFLYHLQYTARRVYKGREVFIFSDDLKVPATSRLKHLNEALPDYQPLHQFITV